MIILNLNFPLLDQALPIERMTVLQIETQEYFARIIQSIYQYGNGGEIKLFDDRYNVLKATELIVISDIFTFDVNTASILKLIYEDLEKHLNEVPEVKHQIEQLSNKITNLMSEQLLQHELDLEIDEITILEIFKALGLKIETASDTLYEKCIEILQVYQYLTKKKVLIFINCLSYFSIEEQRSLKLFIDLLQKDVLFLEHHTCRSMESFVLDDDFCLFKKI